LKYTEKLEYLSLILNENEYKDVINYLDSAKNGESSIVLMPYIKVLINSFRLNKTDLFFKTITYIRSDISHRHTFLTSRRKYSELLCFIRYFAELHSFKMKEFEEGNTFISTRLTQEQYNIYKSQIIPKKISSQFTHVHNAEEIFNTALYTTSPPQIAQRLKEHVNSFKNKKHHRAPLVAFLKQIYKSNKTWYKHPFIIQGELIKYRSNLLDHFHRNTAYGHFQNVKNALSVLIEHALLPSATVLPDNLRRCINTQKMRKNNPLISEVNLYDESKRQLYIDSSTFIESLKSDISESLNIFVTEAQKLVYDGYKKYKAKKSIVKQSQFNEFIKHPKLLVNTGASERIRTKINPFGNTHPLRNENITAYFNHFFDDYVNNNTPHTITHLTMSPHISGYMGLTPIIASAMQIIITEELGINPYSLYRVKVSCSKGHEFVQITDKGSVRLKALKPRAKKTQTRHASGYNRSLSEVKVHNINASICLKMALDMTSRARRVSQRNELWLCISKLGLSLPCPGTFQNQFKIIRGKVASKNAKFTNATLKKVRASKGVLIYLESNGDSLKAASYYGNSVKTTLARYIPSYLTELIYRIKIRSFHNIFLFMSIALDESPSESLNMSEKEFNLQVKRSFNNSDMGGDFFEKLTTPSDISKNNPELYFCVSPQNIKLAIKYAKSGGVPELKKACTSVLSKISEGNVMMKQMLRKAQLTVN
jgi:hypothetical protein